MNIPNILTVIRLILIPCFTYVFFLDTPNSLTYAMIIFLVAGVTDVLDGFIARKFNMVTKVGAVLDPLADKLMLLTVLGCFTLKNYLPYWVITIVLIKELLMIAGGIYLYFHKEKVVIPANKYGKVATVVFYTAIVLTTFNVGAAYNDILIGGAIFMTMVAFVVYLRTFRKQH